MTNEQKAEKYGQLLNEHTKISNAINEIKGQSIDLNKDQLNKIKQLESQQIWIMNVINIMMS